MYWALFILICLLCIETGREPFTLKEVSIDVIDKLQNYSTRPLYKGLIWMIPYKQHYRKWSRYLN